MASRFPIPKFHFEVEWGGTRLGFTEVSGLSLETQVIEYREGSDPELTARKLPGLTKFSNIILKRGMVTGDNEFFKYWQETSRFLEGSFRRDITIKLLNDEHNPVFVWRAKSAWPCKIEFGDLNANSNEIEIETMELTHEGIYVEAI